MNDTLSFLIILEFVMPFALLSIILLIVFFKGNKKNRRGLRYLLEGVQGTDDKYREQLKEFLQKSEIDEEQIEQLLQEFSKNRRSFFKMLLTALSSKDQNLLEAIGSKFNSFSDHYHQLELHASLNEIEEEPEEEENPEPATDNSALIAYKRENKRLKAEVHVSVSALNSLFKEYSSMFGEVPDQKSEMTVQEILEAMEKFTKGEFKPDNITSDLPPELEQEMREKSQQDEMDSEVEVIESEPESETEPEDEADEPSWDEAFEEAGVKVEEETSDSEHESPLEVEKAEKQHASELGDSAGDDNNQPENEGTSESESDASSEPGWDEAFEEAGLSQSEENGDSESDADGETKS